MYCRLVHCLYIFNTYDRKHSEQFKCFFTLTCSLFSIVWMCATVLITCDKQQKQKISMDAMLFVKWINAFWWWFPLNHKLSKRTQESKGAASTEIYHITDNLITIH